MADRPSDDVRAVLDALEAMGAPKVSDLEPREAREVVDGTFAGAEPVEEVGAVEDRTIPGPAGEIPVRVYRPEGDGPHPVVVFFHGGGFVLGDLDGHDAPCRILTNAVEAVVVSVDYRLAPEHPFPAAVEDAYAATEWIAEHAAEIDGDAERIAVAGDSAGGNLAAVVALAARERGGPDLAYQALFYPAVDFGEGDYPSREENAEGYFLSADEMAYFGDHYVPSWAHMPNPYLAPIEAESHADLPPATVVTCGFDPLRDEGRAYAETLEADGVAVIHREYDDLIHGVVNMVQEPMDVTGGHEMLSNVAGDLHDALH
ncbi:MULTISPECIES: alpha/beta hydrolase [Halorussus]|uniref:alpha/beta hydrolase n=1 Tax=Halorussus TaxID=1070314 RepID=UPI0020A056E6|nr:alpha/beta hydrolase [Halorussus vallis]USZ74674.1 alpha/beta hydrolase [Halorussus vallis]